MAEIEIDRHDNVLFFAGWRLPIQSDGIPASVLDQIYATISRPDLVNEIEYLEMKCKSLEGKVENLEDKIRRIGGICDE